RYGGEEFCILLPQTDANGTALAAERLRRKIESHQWPIAKVTVSCGVSAIDAGAAEPRELLDQADKALYAAKRGGRNHVARWGEIPAELAQHAGHAEEHRTTTDPQPTTVPIPFHAVTALSSALAHRDPMTAAHSQRVADL